MLALDLVKFILASAAGGAVGVALCIWIMSQGFYALVLPGMLLGIGASFVRCRSRWWAIGAGVASLLLGLLFEWRYRPFIVDESLPYFFTHLHELKPFVWLMIVFGTYLGFQAPDARYRQDPANSVDPPSI